MREVVLVAHAVGDPLCRVTLFSELLLIVKQYLINDSGEPIQLRSPHWLVPPIARRRFVPDTLRAVSRAKPNRPTA